MSKATQGNDRATQEHDAVGGAGSSDERVEKLKRRMAAPEPRRRRSPLGCLMPHCGVISALQMGLLLVVVIVVVIGLTTIMGFLDDPLESLKDRLGLKTKPARVTDVTVIVEGIREQALLTALEGTEVIWVTTVKERPGLLADAQLRMRYTGQANLGYDLSRVNENNFVIEGDRLIMTLPPVQFTGCALHNPIVEKWDCGTNYLGSGNCGATLREMQTLAHAEGIAQLMAVAEEQDWSDEAFQSAQQTLAKLISGMGYSKIEFRPSSEVVPPHESCLGANATAPGGGS